MNLNENNMFNSVDSGNLYLGRFLIIFILILITSYNIYGGLIALIIFLILQYSPKKLNIDGFETNSKPEQESVTKPTDDDSASLENAGSNLLDTERLMTKQSNTLPVPSKKQTDASNIVPNHADKEGFKSFYDYI
jgi:hypothetical protein